MKKIKNIAMLMLLVLTCAGFAACSDDEESSGDYENMIVGTWSESGAYDDYCITFYPGGKYSESDGSGSVHGQYIIDKGFLTLIEDGYEEYEDVFQIKSLSKTKLVLGEGEYEDWTLYRVD